MHNGLIFGLGLDFKNYYLLMLAVARLRNCSHRRLGGAKRETWFSFKKRNKNKKRGGRDYPSSALILNLGQGPCLGP